MTHSIRASSAESGDLTSLTFFADEGFKREGLNVTQQSESEDKSVDKFGLIGQFKVNGTFVSQSRMAPDQIVEVVDVICRHTPSNFR